ncbi:MAG: 3'-5' exonuclease, partial [Synergistaceae bacterium]|nr:3'-5' exonuclease [Synergistaceae bacterium]
RLGLNEKDFPKRYLKERISEAKNKSTDPEAFFSDDAWRGDTLLKAYRLYRDKLRSCNALDFDDLLLLAIELYEKHPDVLEKHRDRYRYVMVDEYQDTNQAQYQLIRLLCAKHRNICVVGDDDQSIYGWRGADIRNILEFERDFPGAQVIRLEQNYRSTNCILDAANHVIANNRARKRKNLWTAREGGEKITCYTAPNERYEADFVCRRIIECVREGMSYDDFAVLYRMNAQSRVLESVLLSYGIPHKVYGGFRFYERQEVKDVLAYLRLIGNPGDDVAFLRIVNVPRRGIGESALAELSEAARHTGLPLLLAAMDGEGLSPRVKTKFASFTEMISELVVLKETIGLAEFVEKMVSLVRYDEYLRDDKRSEYDSRMQNVMELIGHVAEIERDVEEGQDALQAFLENTALISDADTVDDASGSVSLMTLHSAKGLEFPTVFLVGMEENIFPSSRCANEPSTLEEERRLCYVGITRAKDKLYLINTQQRQLFGNYSYNRPSRFLEEIPEELIEEKAAPVPALPTKQAEAKPRRSVQEQLFSKGMHSGFGSPRAASAPTAGVPEVKEKDLKPFQRISHASFGEGTVLEVSGSGNTQLVTIDFIAYGVKKFAAAYAPITVLKED